MWLAIHFTQLALEVFSSNATVQTRPLVILQNNKIICVNENAAQYGIKLEQNISTALALCVELEFHERNLSLEKQQLINFALMLYQYSPSLCIENDRFLLIEIGRSLKLFTNLKKLLISLQETLDKEKYSYQIGIGNTAKCAELFSYQPLKNTLLCWQHKSLSFDKKLLHKQLSSISITQLNISKNTAKKILSTGIRTLGELKKLPDKSISKRFGKTLTQYLLQLYGELADPKSYFIPEEHFSQKIEFVDVIHSQQGLLFPIKRLIKDLCRFLTIKQKSCHSLHWQLFDNNKNILQFEVLLANNGINKSNFLELSKLNLERHKLDAPIEAISLTVDQLNQLSAKTGSLIDDQQEFKSDTYFVDQIRAKLGIQSCTSIQQIPEHIPELATQQNIEQTFNSTNLSNIEKQSTKKATSLLSHPTWLLEKPQPINHYKNRLSWHGELKIISQKEKITLNWWSKRIIREYFLAEHDNGVIYWVFKEPISKQYFIHGIYS